MNNLYNYITAAGPTTTIVSAVPCVLSGITINKAAANGVITLYDGKTVATGTVIGILTTPATVTNTHVTVDYKDICLVEGLTIVTSVVAQDIIVAYRGA